MRWYFAGRVKHKEKLKEVFKFLGTKGEKVVSDWVYSGSLKPYHENLERVQPFAQNVVKNLKETDILVLISDPEGTDMFIELGVCLGRENEVRIYIVGEHSKRSLMQLHPAINHVADLRELFEKENISCDGFDLPDMS